MQNHREKSQCQNVTILCTLCFCRRYRDKEPTTAPVTTTPRATTPSESKKSTINVTVNPKSLSTTNAAAKPAKTTAKKIDMGAAVNFGRDEIGINSPTHRNTHAEEDLFATNNVIVTAPTASTTANKADLLEDIFKTCASGNDLPSEAVSPQQSNNDDDFFNPREDESQEFGDFASAFGSAAPAVQPSAVVQQTAPPVLPSASPETKKTDFVADFGAAFTPSSAAAAASSNQTLSNSNDPANLLFAINTTPNAQITTSNSNQKVGDLLSDLDGLSLNVSAPTGEFFIIVNTFLHSLSHFHLPLILSVEKRSILFGWL